MKTAVIILLTLGLTLLLIGLNVSLYKSRAHAPPPKEFSLKEVTNTVKRVVRYQPSVQTKVAGKFSWGMVEAADYATYIANLQAIGCPEKTIQDIILADIEKTYETRRETLEAEASKAFWRTGPQIDAANVQLARQIMELDREKHTEIHNLLGIDIDNTALKLWQTTPQIGYLLGYLPESKPERLTALYLRNHDLVDYQRALTAGIVISADQGEQERLTRVIRTEAAQILEGPELDELQLRLAIMDAEDRLTGVELTGDERRKFARVAMGGKDPVQSLFGIDLPTSEEQRLAIDRRVSQEIRDLLGSARFADYQRAQDSRFQEVYSLTELNQLPKSTAIKLFEIRQNADTQAEQARNDPGLSLEQKQTLLDTLRKETQKAIIQYLGQRVYEENQQGVAHWLEPMRSAALSATQQQTP